MILKYVIRNFRRRKVRTILMLLSLMVSTSLIVALNATVETIRRSNIELVSQETGRFDFAVAKTDISAEPYISIDGVSQQIKGTHPDVRQVAPRFQTVVEMEANGELGTGWLIALDQERDQIGRVEVISGTYNLENAQVAVLDATADTYSLKPGDTIRVAYSLPQPRERGKLGSAGASQRRAVAQFTVSGIVRQDGVTTGSISEGLLVDLAATQEWLGVPGWAERLVVVVEPSLYDTRDAEVAALRVREVAERVQQTLGEGYRYELEKPRILDLSAEGFIIIQALINIYGLTALGIVGLLVHTLVMTNVQEQRREMAILRILGGQPEILFSIVIVEVAVIGAISIGLGVILGQILNQHLIIPIIASQIESNLDLQGDLSLSSIVPAVISAAVVLLLSAMKPSRDASHTKVMHAINPGVADNIQIEDLAQLRERRPNTRLFFIGVVMTLVFMLIFFGFQFIFSFGGPSLQAGLIFAGFFLMVLGIGLMFFVMTVPFERLILAVGRLIAPRLTFFARRNVGRGQARNTLISLMILFSGVLPSFLATQVAMGMANLENDVRLRIGAPVEMRVTDGGDQQMAELRRLRPSFLDDELSTVAGLEEMVGLSYGYPTQVTDPVGMREARIEVTGVDGHLRSVLFSDIYQFASGSPESLDLIMDDARAVIISEGLSEHLAAPVGSTIKITGEGLDHKVDALVVGVARRLPGFRDIGRSRTSAQWGSSDVLMSLDGFRELVNDPLYALPPADTRILTRVLAATTPGSDGEAISRELRNRYGLDRHIWTHLAEVDIEQARQSEQDQRVFLLVLTGISFTTAVLGVFAVIYVTIYARRLEIGMMKAMGTRGWELTGTLVVEAITMSLSAALAGMAAGAAMGYLFVYGDNLISQRPTLFALDTTVMPFVVLMVVLASIISAAFSSRRIVRQKAVEILRMG